MNDTLCWDCSKACGECSWSKRFEPVEGWKAVETELKGVGAEQSIKSYCVKECPLYDGDREPSKKPTGANKTPVSMLMPDNTWKRFSSMGSCARYIIVHGLTHNNRFGTIKMSISNGKDRSDDEGYFTAYGILFKVEHNAEEED